jgi:hypothetical protein
LEILAELTCFLENLKKVGGDFFTRGAPFEYHLLLGKFIDLEGGYFGHWEAPSEYHLLGNFIDLDSGYIRGPCGTH